MDIEKLNMECMHIYDATSIPISPNTYHSESYSYQSVLNINRESTSHVDINEFNRNYFNSLLAHNDAFIGSLLHVDFEDGMDNEAIDFVEHSIKLNESVTYNWINRLFTLYMTDYRVISRLLRIIAALEINDYSLSLADHIKAGLADKHVQVQEAALMVIESWASKECVDILRTVNVSNKLIQNYADKLLVSIENKLLKNVC